MVEPLRVTEAEPQTQNPPGFGPWGFDSPSRHQQLSLRNSRPYKLSLFRDADAQESLERPQRDVNVMFQRGSGGNSRAFQVEGDLAGRTH